MYLKNEQIQKLNEAMQNFKNAYVEIINTFDEVLSQHLKTLELFREPEIIKDKYGNYFGDFHFNKKPLGFHFDEPYWDCCELLDDRTYCGLNIEWLGIYYYYVSLGLKLDYDKIKMLAMQNFKNKEINSNV